MGQSPFIIISRIYRTDIVVHHHGSVSLTYRHHHHHHQVHTALEGTGGTGGGDRQEDKPANIDSSIHISEKLVTLMLEDHRPLVVYPLQPQVLSHSYI